VLDVPLISAIAWHPMAMNPLVLSQVIGAGLEKVSTFFQHLWHGA
jgi:hypothetical protein